MTYREDSPRTADDDTLHASAGALAADLAARRGSALEACELAIGRIERLDREINAVVVRDFDRAREQARAADAALARGERRPLLGVPMTVKESFNVAGLPTSWGLPEHRGFVPRHDAVLVERLKTAGAVILGKTNVAPALADWQSFNPVYGRTSNPHDLKVTPGGSSGGSAAAVAAGMVPLELGSDIGGSIRVPAHFCGIYGHKPSQALLPPRGHDFPGADGAPVDLAVCGPLARTAADLDLALGVLAGPDPATAVGYRLALPPPRHESPAGLRVLLLDSHPSAATASALRSALDGLGTALDRAGAVVARSSPWLPDLAASHRVYLSMLIAITTRGTTRGRQVISAHEWFALLDEQALLRRRWQALFEHVDVVLAPPFGTTAFEHLGQAGDSSRRLTIDGVATPYDDQLAWPGIANLAGLPATVAPIGRDPGGLPIGVQVIGPYLEDRTTIAVAGLLAQLS